MSASMLFARLAALRERAELLRSELAGVMEGIPEPPASDGWEPTDDLLLQLNQAHSDLSDAIDRLTPLDEHHVDTPLAAMPASLS